MPDLDHRSSGPGPDRSPDLERAFDALAADLGSSPGRPGAAAAISTVRRRRRTTFASVAVVAALAAGAVALPSLLPGDGRDGRDGQDVSATGTPQELSPEVFTEVTQGWTGPWRTPGPDDLDALDELGTTSCLDSADAEIEDPDRFGDRLLVSDGQVALVLFAEYDPSASERGVGAFERFTRGVRRTCAPGLTETVTGSTRVAHATVTGGAAPGPHDLWIAGAGDRFAGLVVFNPPSGAPEATATAVGEALASALAADESFTASDGLVSGGSGESEGHGSSDARSYTFPELGLADVEKAAAGWDPGVRSSGTGDMFRTTCLAPDWPRGSAWGQSSTLGDGGLLGYAGSTDAAGDVTAILDALRGCSVARWDVHEHGSGAWATTGTEAIFVARGEETIAWLAFEDVPPPTAQAAQGVIGLLEDNLASAEVSEPGAG